MNSSLSERKWDERTSATESLLKQISPIFAVSLASVVRGAEGDGETPFFDGNENGSGKPEPDKKDPKQQKKKKEDAADWWKRGEDPPF